MKLVKLTALAVAVLYLTVLAHAQDADTTALHDACVANGETHARVALKGDSANRPVAPRWRPGWDRMCETGVAKYEAEKKAADAANEATNPALKDASDAARRLGIIP